MTKSGGEFPPPNWHHHPQEGGGYVSHSHEDVDPGHEHAGGPLPRGTYEHPALGPQVDQLPPLPDEVLYRIAAILRQHNEEQARREASSKPPARALIQPGETGEHISRAAVSNDRPRRPDKPDSAKTLVGRLGAYRRWAKTSDRIAATAPAREAFMGRFEREVDPDGVLPERERAQRAEAARRAYYTELALKSVVARRKRVRRK